MYQTIISHEKSTIHSELSELNCPSTYPIKQVLLGTTMNASSTSTKGNVAWEKCRMNTNADAQHVQNVPALSAFWQLTTRAYPPGVNVGYMPAITAPQTNMNVILAILNRTVERMNELELKFTFLEADQCIYNKLLQVLFILSGTISRIWTPL